MIEFPLYLGGTYHWGIRGYGARWEVDDYAVNTANDTVHEIWVRHSALAQAPLPQFASLASGGAVLSVFTPK